MSRIIEHILSPLPLSEFLDKYNYREAVHIKGDCEKFKDLFDWEGLNNELAVRSLNGAPIKIGEGGSAYLTNDARKVIERARAGSTIVLEDIDNGDARLRNFLNSFSDEILTTTRFNLYLSFPGKQGYHLHYDTHDFFILQLEGFKEWHVYPETIKSPLFHLKEHGIVPPTAEQMYLKCTLSKGDVLYVPKGHWHDAISVDEPSVHLTLAMFTPTGIDFLEWFVDEMRDDPDIRKTFPFVLKDDLSLTGETAPSVMAFLEKMKELVIAKFNNETLEPEYRRYLVAKKKNRMPFTFPDQFSPASGLEHFKSVPQSTLLRYKDRTKTELLYAGKVASFNRKATPILEYILSSEGFSRSDLDVYNESTTSKELDQILTFMMKEGLIVAADHKNIN